MQRAYLSPNLTFVWGSRIGPVVRRPKITLRKGNVLPYDAATVTWRARSGSSRVRSYELQRRIAKGAWHSIGLASRKSRRADVWVKPGATVRFRVRALDDKGRRGSWTYSTKRKAAIRGRVGRVIQDIVRPSGERPRATLRFRGRSVGLIAPRGPSLGTARILLNGRRVAEVDLSSGTRSSRRLVWARNFDRALPRTVRVVSADGHVIIGGFLVLR